MRLGRTDYARLVRGWSVEQSHEDSELMEGSLFFLEMERRAAKDGLRTNSFWDWARRRVPVVMLLRPNGAAYPRYRSDLPSLLDADWGETLADARRRAYARTTR